MKQRDIPAVEAADFKPSRGSIDIRFVRGVDWYTQVPAAAKKAGLDRRFAVIQETAVDGCGDMYFDEPLWRALVEFVRASAGQGTVEVLREGRKVAPTPLDDFLEAWDRLSYDDKCPPPVLIALSAERVVLCTQTQYWNLGGGPRPYHDSYTYQIFSDRDVEAEVIAALDRAPGQRGDHLGLDVAV